MPKVIFESKTAPPQIVEAPEGGSLADLCDAVNAPIPFSCRSANCGTCRIEVLEGAELLLPPQDDELDVLDIFMVAPPRFRLACQSQMKAGLSTLRVKAIDEEE
ncbi:MAG: 2Fe-2S iron-sulfur cluster-binding protein [Polyangiaceae bacterium]